MNSACRNLKSVQDKSTDDHFAKLLVQSALSRTVNENISKTNIILWNNFLQSIPQFLFQFARKALLQLLPTSSNLVRWKRLENPICSLCKLKPQTNLHVLSNCGSDIALERYKFRHNAILRLLFEWLQTVINDTYTVCVDLDTVPQNCWISEVLYENVRPDLLLFNNSKIIILELTVCHESNLQKSKIYKQNKYADIKNFLQPKFRKHSVRLFTFEISVLGFISSLTNFCSILSIPELAKSVKSNLINSVLNSTYGIYCKRNMNWIFKIRLYFPRTLWTLNHSRYNTIIKIQAITRPSNYRHYCTCTIIVPKLSSDEWTTVSIVPDIRSEMGRRSFSFASPSIWNSLPQHIRSSDSLSAFCYLLKTYKFLY